LRYLALGKAPNILMTDSVILKKKELAWIERALASYLGDVYEFIYMSPVAIEPSRILPSEFIMDKNY
jgi:hypothetical protein